MSEMLVICGVALLVFGPTELPQIAKKIAKGMRDIRRASDDLRRSIDLDGDDDDHRFRRPPPPEPPPSITGSALTADAADDAMPVIVPASAIAVGSPDPDDAAPAEAEPQSSSTSTSTSSPSSPEPVRG